MRILLMTGIAMGCLAVPVQARAQAQTAPQFSSAADFDVIVVTARKKEEKITDVPLSITALSSDKLAEANIQDAYGLQSAVPNLTVSPSSTAPAAVATFSLRGQAQYDPTGQFDQPVGVYFDGVSIPRTTALSGALVDIQRVEVLRGPQGTLYGRNTTGGAVSIVARNPDSDRFSGFVTGEAGNYDYYKLTGAINVPLIQDALAARFTASYSNRDGYGSSAVERLGELTQEYYRGKVRFDNGGSFKLSLTTDYSKVKGTNSPSKVLSLTSLSAASNLPGQATATNASIAAAVQNGLLSALDLAITATGNPGGYSAAELAAAGARIQAAIPGGYAILRQSLSASRGGTLSDADFYHNVISTAQPLSGRRYGGGLTMSYDIDSTLTLTSITGYQNVKREAILDVDSTPVTLLGVSNRQRSEYWSQEVQLAYTGESLSTIVGGYFGHETGRDNSDSMSLAAISSTTQRLLTDFDYKTYGIFAQADYKLSDTLKVTGGIRWSKEDKRVVLQSTNLNRNTGVITCRVSSALLDVAGVCAGTVHPTFSDYSWLASVDYKPAESLLVYAKVARGFRGGGVNFRSATPTEAVPFRPELLTEYEAGAKFANDSRSVQLNLSVFHDKYTDIQRSVVVFINGASSTVVRNAAKATIWGIEADWVLRPSPRLEFTGNFGYLNTKYNDYFTQNSTGGLIDVSSTPFVVPDITLGVAAKYTLPTSFGDAFLRVSYDLISDRYLMDNAVDLRAVRQDGYGLLGMRFQMDFDAWDASLAVFGTNLTNKKYYTGGTGLDGGLGFNYAVTGTPRMYGISFTKKFGGD